MYYYFLSNFPAVIKINGAYLGTLSNSAKTFENNGGDTPFVEVTSLSFPSKTYAFLLNQEFLSCKNNHISITDLKGGYFIKFLLPISTDFSVIKQEKFEGLTATVFNDNGLKLSIETATDFYYENLDFSFESVNIFPVMLYNLAFLGVEFNGDKKRLALYHITEKVDKKFFSEVTEYSFSNGLYTKFEILDISKHIVEINWEFTNGEFIEEQKNVTQSASFCIANLPKDILPYAFLEDLLVGGEIKEYLTEDMFSKENKLKGYLGNFLGVCPPPIFRNPLEVGLIYAKDTNIFEVNYYIFEFEKGKICNIKKAD